MRYLTLSDVQNIIGGRSRSSIYRDVERGYLPKPIKLGSRLYWEKAQVLEKLQDLLPEEAQQ
jgi:prophage regulatory protein